MMSDFLPIPEAGCPGKGSISLRLADLESWWALHGNCFSCPHIGYVDRYDLQRKYGKVVALKALEARLKCSKCGNRKFNGWLVRKLPR